MHQMSAPRLSGEMHGHEHGHDHDSGVVPHTHLTSVGIDIGSSTSHLMFSRLTVGYPTLHRRHPEVIARAVISRSPVLLTPFSANRDIDSTPIRTLIDEAYGSAGLVPEDIDTGAVIVTGEAARRDNAARIAAMFSEQAGRFVCATAGPRLEATLAAHGSGAVARSRDQGSSILHIDVGGGTTKVSLTERGRIVGTAAFNLGARLLAFDRNDRLARLEPGGERFLDLIGADRRVGHHVPAAERTTLASRMAATLFDGIDGADEPWPGYSVLPAFEAGSVKEVLFSGGVAEYIYGRETRAFGDLGPELGARIASEAGRRGFRVLEAGEAIRATVIGASEYSVQLSGETIHLPDARILPLHNLRTFVAHITWEPPVAEHAVEAIRKAVLDRDPEVVGQAFALALSTPPFIGYGVAQELAAGIRHYLEAAEPEHQPCLLAFEENIGQIVGGSLGPALNMPCIDEVRLSELDFIDVGQQIAEEEYVPVVVKSLAFGA
jgi:ethanolamine utilization protein EutA